MKSKQSTTVLAACVAGAALVAAGCGSSSHTPSTGLSRKGPKFGVEAAYRYAACMRNHGVSNFPDPIVSSNGGGTSIRLVVAAGVGNSPAFKTAQHACQGILPMPSASQVAAQQRQHTQDLLAFARCLRAHGLTNFPDPNAQGQLTLEMIAAAGIDLHQPAILPAARACIGVTHGQITMADVDRAVNGSG
jgi:hypothetical protein